MIFTVIFALFLSGFSNSINVNVSVDTTKPIRTVSDKFLSVTLDISLLMYEWEVLNFTHITPLTSALGPGYLRFGGTHADSTMFYENPSTNTSFENGKVVFSAKDLGQLYDFVNYTGWRLIMDINQQIFNEGTHVWNSSNAKSFLDYASSKQYSMDFELGNEPDLYASHGMGVLNGSEIAENYKLFRQLLNGYDLYKGSIIMGPSTTANGEHLNGTSLEILKDFIVSGGDQAVYAINIHHYYFRGQTATWGDFIEPKRLNGYKDVIQILQSINIHNKTLFNGESSSAYDGGAPNLSDTYLAGFIWLDKLGVGATFGMDAIMRQDIWGGNYGLLNGSQDPLPDYWLSLLYKKLVGETVYGVRIEGGDQYQRLYAASNRNSDGVVVYGEILSNASFTLNFPDFSNFDATLYLLKEGEPGNLTSKTSRLNGQLLSWMSHEPIVSIQGQPVTFPLEIPAYSQIFITLQPKSSQGCPSGWTQLSTVKNKCIKVMQDFKQPWFGARLDCNTFGVNSTLLSIDSVFENSEIRQKSTSSGCDKLFIDLYRNGNAWTWSNGDQGGYRNFEKGYPNADPTQNCVAFDASTGGWKNIDCDLSNCFICQQYIP